MERGIYIEGGFYGGKYLYDLNRLKKNKGRSLDFYEYVPMSSGPGSSFYMGRMVGLLTSS
jgi:hypothetical protein